MGCSRSSRGRGRFGVSAILRGFMELVGNLSVGIAECGYQLLSVSDLFLILFS